MSAPSRSQAGDTALRTEPSERQPLLHDLLVAVSAPTQAWSGRDGQVRARGAHGFFHSDVRVLSGAVVRVGGAEPEAIAAHPDGPGRVAIIAVSRDVDGPGADPTVRLDRLRTVSAATITESLTVTCATADPITADMSLHLSCDLATMEEVKAGRRTVPRACVVDGSLRWSDDAVEVVVSAPDAVIDTTDPQHPVLSWSVRVVPGTPVTVTWSVAASDADAVVAGPTQASPVWSAPIVRADDRRLSAWVDQALDDLAGLQMVTMRSPRDVFLAAGAPWFLTLFGRDALLAARMMLPLGTTLAAGTLRALAAFQGTRIDPVTAEQPGKILHEIRRAELGVDGHVVLPPVYYGTIDATPLWICLLHDAWRWGLAVEEVEELLPNLEAALGWLRDHADPDGDGFLEYADETGRGLANQGWKDSGDSIQFRDGKLAVGPIALAEVQGYAYEAAISGAAILEAFGRDGEPWRAWADRLSIRFRERFWLTDEHGPYVGIALDGDKAVVDTVTSNMGHLLGTGILTPEEARIVAARLVLPDMSSGYGLRTMSTGSSGYWPLKYHGGSVWVHDTAIAIDGLARIGELDAARELCEGLLAAAADFGFRVPELHSGDAAHDTRSAVPYPAACRPQAWSAAASLVVLRAALGLGIDADTGTVTAGSAVDLGAVHVDGIVLGGSRVVVDRPDGAARAHIG